MGCSVFITTNAAGYINQSMAIGDLALITDHINMTHKSYDGGKRSLPPCIIALIVVTLDDQLFNQSGTIFSTSNLYDREMIDLTREAFIEAGLKLTEGPYCYFASPNYESPADIQIMYDLGAATVGASTLPE
jgi:purine nucleoside phosphorylase